MSIICNIFGHKFQQDYMKDGWEETEKNVWKRRMFCVRCHTRATETMRLPEGLVQGIKDNIDILSPLSK